MTNRLTNSNSGKRNGSPHPGSPACAALAHVGVKYPGREYFYAGSQLIGTLSNSVVNYYHQDHHTGCDF